MILTGMSWPDQGIQVVHRAGIGLGAGHEGLDADIHREPAFDAAQHVSGDDELLLEGFFEIVPDAQAGGAGVRQEHVAFGLFAVLDHHIDDVAWLDGDFAGAGLKLLDGHDAFGLVAEVDDDVFGGDPETVPCRTSSAAGGAKWL